MIIRPPHDRGFVLVNALVIIMALSMVAVAVLRDAHRGGDLTAVARDAQQVELIAEAGVVFARDLLRRDASLAPVDHLGEGWALDAYVAEASGGTVTVTVRDLESRLNLNLLATDQADTALPVLQRLALSVGGGADIVQAIEAQFADREREEGAPTFRRGDVTHLAQMGEAAGLEADALKAIAPVLSTLPGGRVVNVNTAEPEVLAALLGAEDSVVDGLVALRQRTPFEEAEAFAAAAEAIAGEGTVVPLALIDTTSNWFEIDTVARYGETVLRSRTIVVRDPETGEVRTFAKQALEAE